MQFKHYPLSLTYFWLVSISHTCKRFGIDMPKQALRMSGPNCKLHSTSRTFPCPWTEADSARATCQSSSTWPTLRRKKVLAYLRRIFYGSDLFKQARNRWAGEDHVWTVSTVYCLNKELGVRNYSVVAVQLRLFRSGIIFWTSLGCCDP